MRWPSSVSVSEAVASLSSPPLRGCAAAATEVGAVLTAAAPAAAVGFAGARVGGAGGVVGAGGAGADGAAAGPHAASRPAATPRLIKCRTDLRLIGSYSAG